MVMHNPLTAANKIVAHIVRNEPSEYREVAEVLPWADPYILSLINSHEQAVQKLSQVPAVNQL